MTLEEQRKVAIVSARTGGYEIQEEEGSAYGCYCSKEYPCGSVERVIAIVFSKQCWIVWTCKDHINPPNSSWRPLE
jgi:hypothetical protein